MKNNIEFVYEKIEEACRRSGRSVKDVQLIAVSKTFPVSVVEQAYEQGLRVFGESRAQEFRDKVPVLPQDIQWHFIGHLQRNKIKYVVPQAHLIHSVDSLQLARSISDYAGRNEVDCSILMEVNTSGEDSKFGVPEHEAESVFEAMYKLPHLQLRGLMTMAPLTDDEGEIRSSFRKLRKILDQLKTRFGDEELTTLSMGMSADFEMAIEEGSTMVRVGSAIFGQRGR